MYKLFEIPSITLFLCAFCAFLWLKNSFNQRNQRLMNYLHAFGIFTTVESALQNHLFMQNEPNLPKAQMNVNKVLTKDYENKPNWTLGENEPKTNPNEPNSKPISNGARVAFEAVDAFWAGYIICPIIVLLIKLQATKRAVLRAFSADECPFVFFV